jgi:hypothetical protein
MRSLLAALALVLMAVTTAGADPVKCTRAINKEVNKYIKQVQKNVDKCKNKTITKGENGGALGNCTVTAIKAQADDKIEKAADKMKAGIAKACGGSNKTCEVPPGDGDDALAAVNWGIGSCMNFEAGQGTECNNPIDTCADIGTCLECMIDKGLEQAIDGLLYDQFNPASFFPGNAADPEKRYNKCQVTIAKAGGKFLLAKQKILSKCWDAKLNGKTGFADGDPCPGTDPGTGSGNPPALPGDNKSVEKIKKAEQKKVAAICKACGGGGDTDKNGVCDTVSGDIGGGVVPTLGDIVSLPYVCPSVTVPPNAVHPLGLNCADPNVTTLQEYVECVDCVLEFKADCLSSAAVGDGNPGLGIAYPGQCNPGVCGNGVQEVGEVCDGGDDDACPGECSSLCTCPITVPFTLDSDSEAVVHPLNIIVPLSGAVDLNVGVELQPGVFPITIGEGQLPGVDLFGGAATVCPFLVEHGPFGSGVSGSGFVNCVAADLTGSGLFESPDVTGTVDHCVQGTMAADGMAADCDSAPNGGGGVSSPICVGGDKDGQPCPPVLCSGGGTCTGSVFVPDGAVDGTCSVPNSPDTTASPNHTSACNGPILGPTEGVAPYDFGDGFIQLNIVLDIRGGGDPCDPPVSPGASSVLISLTTGTATGSVMDFGAAAGVARAARIGGAPFVCSSFLAGSASGTDLVGVFPAIDAQLLPGFYTDTITQVTLAGQ